MLSEVQVSRTIIENYFRQLTESLELDVAICGGGPAGLVAATILAQKGMRTALFDRKLSLGGGMWAGGMLFNTCVVQPEAEEILREFKIAFREENGLLVASSVEAVARLILGAIDSGVKMFNGVSVEDVVVKAADDGEKRVCGFVINWGAVSALNARGYSLEVDPLVISSRWAIDATGHEHEVCRVAQEKGLRLATSSGESAGEGSLWMEKAEKLVVENSRQVFPGLFVCGMAANAVFGAPRMGPIFGGMLRSGQVTAQRLLNRDERGGRD